MNMNSHPQHPIFLFIGLFNIYLFIYLFIYSFIYFGSNT